MPGLAGGLRNQLQEFGRERERQRHGLARSGQLQRIHQARRAGVRLGLESRQRQESADDVAQVLSTLFARPVTSLALPNDAVVPTFTSMGITPDFAELFRQLYAAIDADTLPWLRPANVVRGTTTIETDLARQVA